MCIMSSRALHYTCCQLAGKDVQELCPSLGLPGRVLANICANRSSHTSYLELPELLYFAVQRAGASPGAVGVADRARQPAGLPHCGALQRGLSSGLQVLPRVPALVWTHNAALALVD